MAATCFPGSLNPFCRQAICISPCSDQIALATSTLLYLYSHSNQNLIFQSKFLPHSKSLSCMTYHPTIPGLLITGGAPNSRIIFWSIDGKQVQKKGTLNLQRRPTAFIWLSDDELIIGDEHGSIYRANKDEQKLIKFNNTLLSDKQNDEIQCFAVANKQKFILAISYKSGLVCICHVDLEKNQLNVLHKLPAESNTTICCSIQFAHADSPLDRSTLFYISYAHGCIRVCDYITGKVISQLMLAKQSKNINATDPRCKTYYPLLWLDANTLLTGNLDGHLIRVDVRHSSHLEKSQLPVNPPVPGGKPIFSLAIKGETKLFTYSFHRKLCVYDLPSLTLINSLVSIPGTVNDIQACPLQTSCVALGVDTGNIGILDLSSSSSSSSSAAALSFLWQSIPADVCRLAWHTVREGRIAYSTRLGHVGLYDTLSGRSRVVYDHRYTQPGSPTAILWGPLTPNPTEDPSLAILYTVGDGKFHRWDSPEKNCLPTDLSSLVQQSMDPILSAAFSDDRKYLSILCQNGSLWIRTCPSLDPMHNISINCAPTMMKYHPRYLLSSIEASEKQYWLAVNDKQNIRLINTLEPQPSAFIDLLGHTGDVECLAWSPCFDYLLVSGSQDKTVRLWNVDTAQPLKIYSEHVDAVTSVLFLSTDSNLIISGSRDQALHVWHIEHHCQEAHQPIQEHFIDNDEETSSHSGINKQKRHNKPRPNRAERERKRAAKMVTSENTLDADDPMVSSMNGVMSSCNSLAYRLLWPPSQDDRTTVSDLSTLPDKTTLIERIKDLAKQSSDPSVYHFLFWTGGDHQELLSELNKQNFSSYNHVFFWMAILNDSTVIQPLFDRVLNGMKESHDEYILEFVTMMIKAKRHSEVVDYLIHHDHTESALVVAILSGLIDQIRDHLSSLTQTDQS